MRRQQHRIVCTVSPDDEIHAKCAKNAHTHTQILYWTERERKNLYSKCTRWSVHWIDSRSKNIGKCVMRKLRKEMNKCTENAGQLNNPVWIVNKIRVMNMSKENERKKNRIDRPFRNESIRFLSLQIGCLTTRKLERVCVCVLYHYDPSFSNHMTDVSTFSNWARLIMSTMSCVNKMIFQCESLTHTYTHQPNVFVLSVIFQTAHSICNYTWKCISLWIFVGVAI